MNLIQNVIFGRFFRKPKRFYSMFLQNFQNGKIYKEGDEYVLKIDGKEFTGTSLTQTLEAYSKAQRKGSKS